MRQYEVSRTLNYRVFATSEAEAVAIVRSTEDAGWDVACKENAIPGLREIELIDTTVSTTERYNVVGGSSWRS